VAGDRSDVPGHGRPIVRLGASATQPGAPFGARATSWISGARPRTEDAALVLGDSQVVDAGLTPVHEALRIELPEFVAVAAPPPATAPTAVLDRAQKAVHDLTSRRKVTARRAAGILRR